MTSSGDAWVAAADDGSNGKVHFVFKIEKAQDVAFDLDAFVAPTTSTSASIFTISVDGQEKSFNPPTSSGFAWNSFSTPFSLQIGRHTLIIQVQELGVKLRAVRLVAANACLLKGSSAANFAGCAQLCSEDNCCKGFDYVRWTTPTHPGGRCTLHNVPRANMGNAFQSPAPRAWETMFCEPLLYAPNLMLDSQPSARGCQNIVSDSCSAAVNKGKSAAHCLVPD